MTTKPGRNDPCPCGSGQKYKKCCQQKDEAAARAAAPRGVVRPSFSQTLGDLREALASRSLPPARSPREPTPAERWWKSWGEQMREAESLESQLALSQHALGEGPDPDDEFLLESFEPVLIGLEQAGRHGERLELLDQLEERFPLGFGHSRASFAHERFESAIELPGVDWSAEMRRLGPHVVRLAELLIDLPSRLAWEGRVDALRVLTETGWPAICDDASLSGEAVGEWAGQGIGAVLLEHLARDPTLQTDDTALMADRAPYQVGAVAGSVETSVRWWLGLLQAGPSLPPRPATQELLGQEEEGLAYPTLMPLTAVVASRLRAQQGWTRSQAWVLLRELGLLLRDVARRQREAKPRGDLAGLLLPPTSVLLDRLERRNRGMLASKSHVVAAVVLALPAWAGLMAEQGWVSEAQAHAWQQQCMGEAGARWGRIPQKRRDALAHRVLAFTAGEGRSRDAWLR